MARLGDTFVLIRNGASIKQTVGAGGIPITRIETIANREVDRNKFGYAGILDIQKYSDYVLRDEDILMSHINSEKHLGKAAIYKKVGKEIIIHGMNLLMLRANPKIVFSKYALYFFETPFFQQQIIKITKKSVNQASFTVTDLKDVEIPLPPLETQKDIAAVLDKLSSLISLHKQQLAKLDELVKARFVEMFGDCKVNNKGFEQLKGNELFKFSSGKFLPEEKRKGCGVPVYGGNGIAWYTDTFLIEYPTIIIGRVGAQCGNIHLVTEPVWITDNAIYIKEQKTDKFRLKFLSELMIIMNFYQYADFSGQPKITQKPLENTLYLVPPVKLQEQFSDFAGRVDRHKLTIQQSLDTLEVLKKSLMQEYFS